MAVQISNDILKLPSEVLELERPFKLFDMKKFQQNVNWELKRQYPERRKLETQVWKFGNNDANLQTSVFSVYPQ